MESRDVATRLLGKVIEMAKAAYKVTPGSNRPLPSYNRTPKTGRAGSDSTGDAGGAAASAAQNSPVRDDEINPDQFNKPREHEDLDDVDEIDIEVSADQPTHAGHMIALFLEPTIAQRLAAKDSSAPNDERHITVAHLPDGAPPEVDELVDSLAAQTPPFHGYITGTASFPPKETHGSALYATVDVPGLQQFRRQLVDQLSAIDIPVGRPDTFTPHITLRYYQEGEQPPPHPLDNGAAPIPIRLAKITIARSGDLRDFPLGRDL